ncbi:MAG: GNAT family N-acetyltransferase [Phycisphaerales bacterium]|nr:GNAT family N-acetyltransferase [Phycisphaerales bacterium]
MTAERLNPEVVSVDKSRLSEVYALACDALVYDTFSADLLAEKLFHNPQPGIDAFDVYGAVVDGRLVGFMQAVTRRAEHRGWVGIFAVERNHHRQGIATALLDHVKAVARKSKLESLEALAIPSNYFTPGLDPRYTPALGFLQRGGFERFGDCANLIGDLSEPFETASDEDRLRDAGVTVRRATRDDDALLDAFFATEFGPGWRLEAELAMNNDPPALHLALRGERIIAFSGHSSQNREWGFFGPMGTLPETRGLGIGRVLLRRCLNDLRDAGHRTALIPWVGPIAFYAYHADCCVDRVFWRYRLKLT